MNKVLKGMALTYASAISKGHSVTLQQFDASRLEAMKAALLWLADNVTDEMVLSAISHPTYPAEKLDALRKAFQRPDAEAKAATEVARAGISRALRAAAEGK